VKDPTVLLRATSLFTKATTADDARLPRAFRFSFVIYKKKETLFSISDTIIFYVCHAKNKKPWPSATDVIKLLISTFFFFHKLLQK